MLLVGVTPAGFEKMFEERQGVDAETNRALVERHKMEVVGPRSSDQAFSPIGVFPSAAAGGRNSLPDYYEENVAAWWSGRLTRACSGLFGFASSLAADAPPVRRAAGKLMTTVARWMDVERKGGINGRRL